MATELALTAEQRKTLPRFYCRQIEDCVRITAEIAAGDDIHDTEIEHHAD